MHVFVVLISLLAACAAAPGGEDDKVELFEGVNMERDSAGSDLINVKFQPGELKEAARTFQEARGKIKKYAPLLAGLGVKAVAVIGVLFGGLVLLVTKALLVAKLALVAATALGLQKFLSAGALSTFGFKDSSIQEFPYKIASWQPTAPQWSAQASSASYPYARSSNIHQDTNDLAFKAQVPS